MSKNLVALTEEVKRTILDELPEPKADLDLDLGARMESAMNKNPYPTEEQLREWRAARPPMIRKPKPKAEAVVTMVSEKFAAAAKANPETVRMYARTSEDQYVIERPRRSDVVEVLEIDAEGRPKVARSYNPATGEHGTIEFEGGYRRPAGAVSNYDPFAGLGRDE